MVEKAMKDVHYSVKPNRNSKQQALEVIHLIKAVLPLERAMMRLKIESSSKEAKKLLEKFSTFASTVESLHWDSGELTLILLIDPGNYRQIDELVRTDTKGTTNMEVLSLKEVIEGDSFLD
ncbi:Ribosome maturation protein SBDS, C-terminal [Cinara cedri]|uniref:Ribosome maturation protein SBDS, C-terminal n=1 Tax=Cinara cedri TaxID=506608 RepID=A0A5E4MG14_9HEMI|nr:Ribosome maturation protein SBDS, C-terminal [Cinara cedri]